MNEIPACPVCSSVYAYEMGSLLVCPECAHEWQPAPAEEEFSDTPREVKDAHGNVLAVGDDVTIIKDLKVKGSSSAIKVGTKVRNIKLVNGADGHDIDARVDGFGSMMLKSSVVKKS